MDAFRKEITEHQMHWNAFGDEMVEVVDMAMLR